MSEDFLYSAALATEILLPIFITVVILIYSKWPKIFWRRVFFAILAAWVFHFLFDFFVRTPLSARSYAESTASGVALFFLGFISPVLSAVAVAVVRAIWRRFRR